MSVRSRPTPESTVPNLFGRRLCIGGDHGTDMSRSTTDPDDMPTEEWLSGLAAPEDRPVERLDARELPPPEPLRETLERLPELDDEVVFVQLNDREPKLLYPKLDDRGYRYDSAPVEEGVVTAVWR